MTPSVALSLHRRALHFESQTLDVWPIVNFDTTGRAVYNISAGGDLSSAALLAHQAGYRPGEEEKR